MTRVVLLASSAEVTSIVSLHAFGPIQIEAEREDPIWTLGDRDPIRSSRVERLSFSMQPLSAEDGTVYTQRVSPPADWPTPEMVEAFKAEWNLADGEGDIGNRVRRGLLAALHAL